MIFKSAVHPWWQPSSSPSACPSDTRKNSLFGTFFHDSVNDKYVPDGSTCVWKCQKSSISEGANPTQTPSCIAQVRCFLRFVQATRSRAPTVSCWQGPFPKSATALFRRKLMAAGKEFRWSQHMEQLLYSVKNILIPGLAWPAYC